MQPNSMTSLMIDDPLQIGECFLENHIRLTKTELQELVYQLADGELHRRLEAQLKGEGWEINGSAVRFAITNNSPVNGARLVKGHRPSAVDGRPKAAGQYWSQQWRSSQ
jgi:hypothetical protein